MVCGNELRAPEIEPFAAKARDALGGLEKGLRGATAEAADYFRLDHGELAHEKGRAGDDFVLFRQAVFRGAALHHIADIDILAAQAHGLDHLSEQFSGATDEWLALKIFVAPGALANENKLRFGIT